MSFTDEEEVCAFNQAWMRLVARTLVTWDEEEAACWLVMQAARLQGGEGLDWSTLATFSFGSVVVGESGNAFALDFVDSEIGGGREWQCVCS